MKNLQALFQPLGIKVVIRNFVADYYDKDGQFFNKAMQAIDPFGASTNEFVEGICEMLVREGYTVLSIVEVFGDISVEEITAMDSGSGKPAHPFQVVYADAERIQELANVAKQGGN